MSALTCPPCRICGHQDVHGWPTVMWRRVLMPPCFDWLCFACAQWDWRIRRAA